MNKKNEFELMKQELYKERLPDVLADERAKKTYINRMIESEDGSFLKKNEVSTSKVPSEPDFIKIYLQDIVVLKGLPGSIQGLLYEILKIVEYDTHEFYLPKRRKEKIAKNLGINSVQQVSNGLQKLKKAGVVLNVYDDNGKAVQSVFEVNPFLFGKGGWKYNYEARDIHKLSILYCPEGKVLVNEDILNDIEKNQMAQNVDAKNDFIKASGD